MNSVRIAIAGVLVKLIGVSAVEGFIYNFERRIIFGSALVFWGVVVIVVSAIPPRKSLAERFIDVNKGGTTVYWQRLKNGGGALGCKFVGSCHG